MAIDQYAICPCGSGKKLKFCKCFDSIGEMDRVLKMVQGGQLVAAIDRLNQVFKQYPNAAWALAIKGRLLIGMDEVPALAENADRFIQLQPSNPLALAQKAAAQTFQRRFGEAAHSILEAMSESGTDVDGFLIEICTTLAVGLLRERNVLSSRMFATIAMMAADDEEHTRMPQAILQNLNNSEELNLLLKTLPTSIARPVDASWGERFDEAQSLLYSNQILAAEAKLEALDRQFHGEPAIMMGLFVSAVWRADMSAQAALLAKISESLTDDPEKAARLLAISWLLEPYSPASTPDQEVHIQRKGLAVDIESLQYTLTDTEHAILELTSNERCQSLEAPNVKQVVNEDGIAPRAGFMLLDRAAKSVSSTPLADEELQAFIESLPVQIGTAFIYGRQTDREPTLTVLGVLSDDQSSVDNLIRSMIESAVESKREKNFALIDTFVWPRKFVESPPNITREQRTLLPVMMLKQHFENHFLQLRPAAFSGKSLAESANDPNLATARTALVRSLQGDPLVLSFQDELNDLAVRLNVERLEAIRVDDDEMLETLAAIDLPRVDIESLKDDSLYFYFERVSQVGLRETANEVAKKLIKMDPSVEDNRELIMRAYVTLVGSEPDPQQAIKIGEEANQFCEQHRIVNASILLSMIPRYLEYQDFAKLSATVQEIQQRYGQSEEVMRHLANMLVQMGLINPDGSPRQSRSAPAPKSAAGLFGGDSASAAPAASPAAAGQQETESKLWLPGMD
jgi:hypothetical protein